MGWDTFQDRSRFTIILLGMRNTWKMLDRALTNMAGRGLESPRGLILSGLASLDGYDGVVNPEKSLCKSISA